MTLHREGYGLVTLAAGMAVATVGLLLWLETEMWLIQLVSALGLLDVVLIAQFFRIPKRVPVAKKAKSCVLPTARSWSSKRLRSLKCLGTNAFKSAFS